MCIRARPPEVKAWRTAENETRFRKDLTEICALGRPRGRHILRKLSFYSGKIIFFSFHPSSFLLSPHAFIPPTCVIIRWIGVSVKGSSSFLLQCPYSEGVFLVGAEACTGCPCMGFPPLEKFAPLTGYTEGLQLRQRRDFILFNF